MTATAQDCLERFAKGLELVRCADARGLYHLVEDSLAEQVGFKLLTLLHLDGLRLIRVHSSDLLTYPVGGSKDISHDAWLTSMLQAGKPTISEHSGHIRSRFFDHEAILALNCESALNVPVMGPHGALGSINLLHEEGWFQASHILLILPWAALLALLWTPK